MGTIERVWGRSAIGGGWSEALYNKIYANEQAGQQRECKGDCTLTLTYHIIEKE